MTASSPTSAVKRFTVFCRDIEASLALYRDILGLKIAEDKSVEGPQMGSMIGYPEGVSMRIVHLQAGEAEDGLIGLYAIQSPRLEEMPRSPKDRVLWGQTAMVLRPNDPATLFPKIEAAGYDFLRPPIEYRKTEDTGYMAAGRYIEGMFWDPDGVLVSLFGYLGPLED